MPSIVGSSHAARVGVALVDAVPLFRDGVSALVLRTPGLNWLGAAENAGTAVRLCGRLHPDVVLVDSGVDPRSQLGGQLAEVDPRTALLVLVRDQHRTTQYLSSAFAAGALGVVSRSVEPQRLVDAIRAVHGERRYLDPVLAPILAVPRVRQAATGAVQTLSRREFQVLQLVADGLENQAIAKVLYVSVETVRTHVKAILRKLSARDRTHAVAVAFRAGVLATDTPTDAPSAAPTAAPSAAPTAPGG